MLTQFSRTELLLGKEAMDKLKNSRVAVFGIGGVGGYVCEALVRSGIGAFDLIDDDKVCLTNLNRQIIATRKTVGKYKVDVMKERMLEINPDVNVRIHKCFFLPENADEFPFDEYDYVVDAVDTVTAKIELVMKSQAMNVPIISSMGAGNKLDASAFKVADIYKTQMLSLIHIYQLIVPRPPKNPYTIAELKFTLNVVDANASKAVKRLVEQGRFEEALAEIKDAPFEDWRNFRRKVLEVAKKELEESEYSEICFDYEPVKSGDVYKRQMYNLIYFILF